MKIISLWQPWASLWVNGDKPGCKRIETRHWPLRGQLPMVLAVHAAKKWDEELKLLCAQHPFREALQSLGVHVVTHRGLSNAGERRAIVNGLAFGAVVGLVRVAECCDTVGLASRHGSYPPRADETEQAFGDYSPGRYGWVGDRFHALAEPIPLRGQQGIWDWDAPPHVQEIANEWSKEVERV